MILSEETEYDLSPLTARILHPEKCKLKHSNEIWLFVRRNYGTGKTLYAFKLLHKLFKTIGVSSILNLLNC
jgi:hypothetical protein